MEIFETKLLKFSGLCCKIQMRNVSGIWQQRHIWYPPTPFITEERIDPWIRSIQIPPGKHFHPVEIDSDEEDDTMAKAVITLRPVHGYLAMYLDSYTHGPIGVMREMSDGTWSGEISGDSLGSGWNYTAKTQALALAKVRKHFNDL